jgi:hypothetical protein
LRAYGGARAPPAPVQGMNCSLFTIFSSGNVSLRKLMFTSPEALALASILAVPSLSSTL